MIIKIENTHLKIQSSYNSFYHLIIPHLFDRLCNFVFILSWFQCGEAKLENRGVTDLIADTTFDRSICLPKEQYRQVGICRQIIVIVDCVSTVSDRCQQHY